MGKKRSTITVKSIVKLPMGNINLSSNNVKKIIITFLVNVEMYAVFAKS
jgi:hypothetical protein